MITDVPVSELAAVAVKAHGIREASYVTEAGDTWGKYKLSHSQAFDEALGERDWCPELRALAYYLTISGEGNDYCESVTKQNLVTA